MQSSGQQRKAMQFGSSSDAADKSSGRSVQSSGQQGKAIQFGSNPLASVADSVQDAFCKPNHQPQQLHATQLFRHRGVDLPPLENRHPLSNPGGDCIRNRSESQVSLAAAPFRSRKLREARLSDPHVPSKSLGCCVPGPPQCETSSQGPISCCEGQSTLPSLPLPTEELCYASNLATSLARQAQDQQATHKEFSSTSQPKPIVFQESVDHLEIGRDYYKT